MTESPTAAVILLGVNTNPPTPTKTWWIVELPELEVELELGDAATLDIGAPEDACPPYPYWAETVERSNGKIVKIILESKLEEAVKDISWV